MKRRLNRSGGFTLLEVILAAAIFVLLAGGVYLAVSVAVSSATQLATHQIDARKDAAFEEFLRNGLLNLPPEAELSVRVRQSTKFGDRLELVIKYAAGAFRTGALDFQGSGAMLQLAPDDEGGKTIGLTRFSERLDERDLASYLDTAQWLPLLSNVERLRWRFWDKNANRFVEDWNRGAERPQTIELTLKPVAQQERIYLFRVPELARVQPVQASFAPPQP